jgi:hypothetical protein
LAASVIVNRDFALEAKRLTPVFTTPAILL